MKPLAKLSILLSLIGLISCGKQNTTNVNSKLHFNVPQEDYVILENRLELGWPQLEGQPTSLSENELIEIELIIQRAIVENNRLQKKALERHNREYPEYPWKETGYELSTDGFKRQYVPAINEIGQKIIWINFFCDDWGNEQWKSEIITVLDGGNCYFQIMVNLATKSYSELGVNGYA